MDGTGVLIEGNTSPAPSARRPRPHGRASAMSPCRRSCAPPRRCAFGRPCACNARPGASRPRRRDSVLAALQPAVRFSLDRPATVTVSLASDTARSRELGRTTVSARRGPNAVALATGGGRRALRPGRYRVTVTAVAGGRSAAAVQTVAVRRG